jgi:hypothetical protein
MLYIKTFESYNSSIKSISTDFKNIFNYLKNIDIKSIEEAVESVKSEFGYNYDSNRLITMAKKIQISENKNESFGELFKSMFTELPKMFIELWNIIPRFLKWSIASIVALTFAINIYYYSNKETITFTVKDKQIKMRGVGKDSEDVYMVYTDKGVFENTDDIFLGKWNSSDIQNDLEVGKTYKVEVYGWRIQFLSTYKNISNVEKL